ncbi:MBL fold metallo-hydrolase [Lyngbya confervoides]|uniref:MBL fold metallo-hydrolase n=1 Tax=Lyngbya confervoides BDU141951 TaxID=1574623 RepID=A0ABD4SZ91_9CYAN|nr:MBL fold metallo-hydrolase [Lyngbya confervoides]MCM1981465.1 MBL fold metallo-hydrolase [Lyngbya confervoides BDU141951]
MSKEPQLVLDSIYAFSPNRHTLGGTAYFIVKNHGNILIDCPPWGEKTQRFLQAHGGVDRLIVTHRGGLSPQIPELQAHLDCEIVIHEQEAYRVRPLVVQSFGEDCTWADGDRLLWTPGHSPGSSCYYCAALGGILFSGRHLLPNAQGQLAPLKTAKTFHWPRQLQQLQRLVQEFSPETLQYILPGANLGLLRGRKYIENAYRQIQAAQQAFLLLKRPGSGRF